MTAPAAKVMDAMVERAIRVLRNLWSHTDAYDDAELREMLRPALEAALSAALAPDAAAHDAKYPGRVGDAPSGQGAVRIVYTNHRGQTGERTISPSRLFWGNTEWHPEPQWLLEAHDVDKCAMRVFAVADIHDWRDATGLAAPAPAPDAWQPIETAPAMSPDGEPPLKVMVIGGAWNEPTIVRADGNWWRARRTRGSGGVPTHWGPLPPPPSEDRP